MVLFVQKLKVTLKMSCVSECIVWSAVPSWPGTHCAGDWVGRGAGLDGSRKSHPHRGHHQAHRESYTNYTVLVAHMVG